MSICQSFAEANSAVAPRVTSKNIEVKNIESSDTFVGICSGQGFPVPKYRLVDPWIFP